MNITFEDDGLSSDGAGLSASSNPGAAPDACQPPASDSVSVALTKVFNQWSTALWDQLNHAGQQRQAGGISVSGTARGLRAQESANAAAVAAITSGAGTTPVTETSAGPPALPTIAPPPMPDISALAAPPPLTGEEVARYVHEGPGSDSIRGFAQSWRASVAPQVSAAADETHGYGAAINGHWDDGRQQAGANTIEHADWLSSEMHTRALSLADRAEEYASQVDTLVEQTPHPREFDDLHRKLNKAVADYRASGGLNAAQVMAVSTQLADKQRTAVQAYHEYFAAAATTAGSVPGPPAPAPPIVRGPQAETLQPKAEPVDDAAEEADGFGGDEHGKGPDGEALVDVPGEALAAPGDVGNARPQGVPAPALDTTAPGVAANIAGTIVGAGTGALGQLAGSLPGAGAGSPLSALSGLSSLPGMGGMPSPQMPQMPEGLGSGEPSPEDLGLGDDFGSGGTTPASDGGGAGGGGGAGLVSSPAVGSSPVAPAAPTASLGGGPATPTTGSPGMGGGMGGGMYPPFMGGLNPGGDGERDKSGDRRVVLRSVPNTEPVFGELERKRSSGGRRRTQEEENREGNS